MDNVILDDPSRQWIPARSRRQAMDWSLALISQGIEAIIEMDEGRWGLIVQVEEGARSLEILDRYERENHGWRNRMRVVVADYSWHPGALVWVAILIVFHGLTSDAGSRFQLKAAMDSLAVSHGEWWRLFTAVMMHADSGHLASNLVFGMIFVGLAMGRFGWGLGLLIPWLAGAAGNVLGWLTHGGTYQGLGASGAVMGALGMLASGAVETSGGQSLRSRLLTGLGAVVMLFVLYGLNPDSDIQAHFGGFLFGLASGGILSRIRSKALQKAGFNRIVAIIWACGVIVTWALAFTH